MEYEEKSNAREKEFNDMKLAFKEKHRKSLAWEKAYNTLRQQMLENQPSAKQPSAVVPVSFIIKYSCQKILTSGLGFKINAFIHTRSKSCTCSELFFQTYSTRASSFESYFLGRTWQCFRNSYQLLQRVSVT